MERRKFVIGLGAIAAGGAAAMGSGAFTSVEATRDFTVEVSDDADAYLALNKMEDSPNADEHVTEEDGVLGVSVTDTEAGGSGVNRDATTIIRDLFSIENRGTQGVYIWVEDEPDGVGLFSDDDTQGTDTGIGVGDQPSNDPLGTPNADRQFAEPGESLNRVGLWVTDAEALEEDDSDTITIWAATEEEIEERGLGAYEED